MVVSDNVSLDDVGQWEAIAAAVISAAAQGAGMAVQINQAKKAQKAAAKQASADAAQAAAMFDKQLAMQQPVQGPGPGPMAPGMMPQMAPQGYHQQRGGNIVAVAGGSGTDWNKILIIGGSALAGVAVLGIMISLLRN
jgi:hypothetical protein